MQRLTGRLLTRAGSARRSGPNRVIVTQAGYFS